MCRNRPSRCRRGGVYIAVLGTALIVSLLGLTAIIGQRLQSRMLTASADIRQAQLNAETATQLGLLTLKDDGNWRSQRNGQFFLFDGRGTGTGSSCSLQAFDAATDPASATIDKPVRLLGIGRHGRSTGDAPRTLAEQRFELVVDPRRTPHDCLKPANAAVPGWQSVFDHYSGPPRAAGGVGTKLEMTSLPNRTPSFSRNPSLDSGHTFWTGDLPNGLSSHRDADGTQVGAFKSHSACLLVQRNDWREGAANRLNVSYLKPDTDYEVSIEIQPEFSGVWGHLQWTRFRISLVAEFADGTTSVSPTSIVQELRGNVIGDNWTNPPVTGTVRTPSWTQHPTSVYLVVNSNDSAGTHKDFYLDNLDFYESGARFIYQKVLGPGVNTLYTSAPTSPTAGIYWIDCQNNKLVIERSRICGTLLLVNPGPGSNVAYGPVNFTPAVAGYPTLIVSNADGNTFAIRSTTTTTLQEADNGRNFNPTGAPHKTLGTNATSVDSYTSEIHGLVLVSGNLQYANSPAIRGKAIVGGTVTGTPSLVYQPDALINPPPPRGVFYTYRYDTRPASTRKALP